jgi:hypothetical protein
VKNLLKLLKKLMKPVYVGLINAVLINIITGVTAGLYAEREYTPMFRVSDTKEPISSPDI